jgi:hypothetical protein
MPVLEKSRVFDSLSPQTMVVLIRELRSELYPPQAPLCVKGTHADRLFIVHKGTCELVQSLIKARGTVSRGSLLWTTLRGKHGSKEPRGAARRSTRNDGKSEVARATAEMGQGAVIGIHHTLIHYAPCTHTLIHSYTIHHTLCTMHHRRNVASTAVAPPVRPRSTILPLRSTRRARH